MKTRLMLLCLAVLAMWFAVPTTTVAAPEGAGESTENENGDAADADYIAASNAFSKGDYDAALGAIARYIAKYPKDVDGYIVKGRTQYALGRYVDAEKSYRKAIDLDKESYTACYWLACSLYMQDKHEQARKALDLALKIRPKDLASFSLYGDCYYFEQDYTNAVVWYSKALDVNDRLRSARLRRGNSYYMLYQLDEALADADAAVTQDASNGEAWGLKADVLLQQRKWAESEEAYKKAIDNGAAGFSNLANLAYVQIAQDEFEQAIETNRQALELRPSSSSVRMNLVHCLASTSRFEEALTQTDILVATDEDNLRACIARAYLLSELDRRAEAAGAWREICRRESDTKYRVEYAKALNQMFRHEEALAALKELDGKNPAVAAVRSKAWREMYQPERSIEELEKAENGEANVDFLRERLSVLEDLYRFDEMDASAEQLDKLLGGVGIADFGSLVHELVCENYETVAKLIENNTYAEIPAPELLKLKALIAAVSGKLDEADQLYASLLESRTNAKDHATHAHYLNETGRARDAEAEARKAIESNAWSSYGYRELATALCAQGNEEDALSMIRQGLDKNPWSARLHEQKARIYIQAGKLELADAEVSKSYSMNPNDEELLVLRAALVARFGSPDKTLVAIQDAEARVKWLADHGVSKLSLKPLQAALKLQRARLAEQEGDADAAVKMRAECIAALQEFKKAGRYLSPTLKTDYVFKSVQDEPEFVGLWK